MRIQWLSFYILSSVLKPFMCKERKTASMLPPAWIMVFFYFRVGLSLCNPETGITRVRGPWRLLPPFTGEHLARAQISWFAPISLKGKPLGSHMVGWKYLVHPDTPTMIGWTMCGRVHQKSLIWVIFWAQAAQPQSSHRFLCFSLIHTWISTQIHQQHTGF